MGCHLGNPLKASLRPLKEGQCFLVCLSSHGDTNIRMFIGQRDKTDDTDFHA